MNIACLTVFCVGFLFRWLVGLVCCCYLFWFVVVVFGGFVCLFVGIFVKAALLFSLPLCFPCLLKADCTI